MSFPRLLAHLCSFQLNVQSISGCRRSVSSLQLTLDPARQLLQHLTNVFSEEATTCYRSLKSPTLSFSPWNWPPAKPSAKVAQSLRLEARIEPQGQLAAPAKVSSQITLFPGPTTIGPCFLKTLRLQKAYCFSEVSAKLFHLPCEIHLTSSEESQNVLKTPEDSRCMTLCNCQELCHFLFFPEVVLDFGQAWVLSQCPEQANTPQG